jgi:tetratricopeptide (TPR) repeat protein
MRTSRARLGCLLLALATACAGPAYQGPGRLPPGAQALSLDGRALYPPPSAPEGLAERLAALETSRRAFEADSGSADTRVDYGRRLAQLGFFREALTLFEAGEKRFPSDARFPRLAGHREITLRRPAAAEQTLLRARAKAEGQPDFDEPSLDPGGRALESFHHAIEYHLGLARFLQGDFAGAEEAYGRSLAAATNDDARCSATHWLVMSLARQGKGAEARARAEALGAELQVVEYHSYHKLIQLYQGRADAEALLAEARAASPIDHATLAFGLGHWHLVQGRPERAREIFAEIEAAPAWHAFGHIAAEYELARLSSFPN